MENYDIDFIIPWVDDKDQQWREDKKRHWENQNGRLSPASDVNADANNEARFRDWKNLKYWFRAVEKYAPWVHHIYFVTCGHYPEWINLNHPKLTLVTHKDYIPEKYLPTFSANPIEINFHRINGLTEHFVYFNDDMFLTKEVTPDDFFKNGLPREMAIQYPLSNGAANDTFQHMLLTMAGQLNAHFDLRESIRHNRKKWYHPSYGKLLIHNLYMSYNKKVSGLVIPHVPSSLRKSTMEEVWGKIGPMMDATSSHKFRDPNDITQYIFRFWEIMKGSFEPTNIFSYAEEFHIGDGNIERLCNAIRNRKYKMICVNDDIAVENVDTIIKKVREAFDSILPEKSSYEI